MVLRGKKLVFLDKIFFALLCVFALLSCTEDLGTKYFLRIVLFVGLLRFMLNVPRFTVRSKHLFFIATFLLALLASVAFNANNPDYVPGLKIIRSSYISSMIPFFLILSFVRTAAQIRILLVCMILSFCVTNISAIIEFFSGAVRVSGLSGHVMPLAGQLILLVPTLLLLIVDQKFMPEYRKLFMFAFILSVPVVFFNATRIVWIVLAITIPVSLACFYNNSKKFRMYCYVCLLGFFIVCSILPSTQVRLSKMFDMSYQSNSERVLMWTSAWNMFNDHPLFGVGIGNYEQQYYSQYISLQAKERNVHAHNNIMHLAASAGIVGVAAYISMLGYFLFESMRKWRQDRSIAALLFFTATLGIFIHGFTDYNIGFILSEMRLYWILLAFYLILDQLIIVENR